MPFQQIPDLDLKYALINFDDHGKERTDDPSGGKFSDAILETCRQEKPTHIFLFSHGWKGDVPAAIDQYNRWIGAMWRLTDDRAFFGADFRPRFIGLHWPSQPWGEESVAAATAASFGTAGLSIDPLLNAAVEHFGGGADVRAPLEVIFRAFEQDPTTRELPPEVVAAYHDLANAIGFSSGAGAEAPPDQEGAALDPQAAVKAERLASPGASFSIFGAVRNGILAGLRQTSFWLMKHRARTVGEQGMHQFVSQLQGICDANVHLMGHSFGSIVVSSILGGPGGKGSLPRPVDSVALVQGALSLWSFADQIPDSTKPGYFRGALSETAVKGPIFTTQSVNDLAVGVAYPAAVGLVDEVDFAAAPKLPKFGGVGAWGIQGTSVADSLVMLEATGKYDFQPGRVYNVDGSRFIPSHSGIDNPQVAHALWQAAAAATGRG